MLVTPELVHPLDSRDGHENLPLPVQISMNQATSSST